MKEKKYKLILHFQFALALEEQLLFLELDERYSLTDVTNTELGIDNILNEIKKNPFVPKKRIEINKETFLIRDYKKVLFVVYQVIGSEIIVYNLFHTKSDGIIHQ